MKIYLTEQEFDELLEYSCTVPTGVYIGKQWKRKVDYYDVSKGWLLGEYVQHKDLPVFKIRWKDIVIVGVLEIDKDIEKFNERRLKNEM